MMLASVFSCQSSDILCLPLWQKQWATSYSPNLSTPSLYTQPQPHPTLGLPLPAPTTTTMLTHKVSKLIGSRAHLKMANIPTGLLQGYYFGKLSRLLNPFPSLWPQAGRWMQVPFAPHALCVWKKVSGGSKGSLEVAVLCVCVEEGQGG